MPWTTATPISLWAILFLPAFVLLWIFPPRFKLTAVLVFLSLFAANLYSVLAINWAIVNYWLRVIPLILTLALGIRFWFVNRKHFNFEINQVVSTPWLPAKKPFPLGILVFSALVFLLFAAANFLLLRSTSYASYTGKPVLLFYPVRYGLYVIVNGGNGFEGIGMNDAYQDWLGRKTGNQSMSYAVDFMKMKNDRGWISAGILPAAITKYEGFRDPVYSPCVGKVVYVEDGHPDVVLGTPEAPLGNRVVLQCAEFYVTVANLRKDSVIVKVGESINYRVQIGQTGSSGSPSIPHVRVFTTRKSWDENGIPVPQLFDIGFRFHVRNDLTLPDY